MGKKLSHIDESGNASMVNVGEKENMKRFAQAEGKILLQNNTLKLIREDAIKKGDVITVSQIAGIMASKKTSELIPLCHNILIEKSDVICKIVSDGIVVTSEAWCSGKTGIEMEALTSVSVALLTIYDMCKAVDKTMTITNIRLIKKTKQNDNH